MGVGGRGSSASWNIASTQINTVLGCSQGGQVPKSLIPRARAPIMHAHAALAGERERDRQRQRQTERERMPAMGRLEGRGAVPGPRRCWCTVTVTAAHMTMWSRLHRVIQKAVFQEFSIPRGTEGQRVGKDEQAAIKARTTDGRDYKFTSSTPTRCSQLAMARAAGCAPGLPAP